VETNQSKRGGFRPNAGRKPGFKLPSTLAKHEAREAARQVITANLVPLIQAAMDNALGLKHLVLRNPKTGEFTRVTGDAKQVDKALKSKSLVTIYTKDPNMQAFTDLMNRALDKPAEHVSIAGADGGPLVIRWQRAEDSTLDLDSKVEDLPPSSVRQIPDET